MGSGPILVFSRVFRLYNEDKKRFLAIALKRTYKESLMYFGDSIFYPRSQKKRILYFKKGLFEMESTNRKWLFEQNEYDLLRKMNQRLQERDELCGTCILDIVTGKYIECPTYTLCEECIQSWLNAKRGGGCK